MFTPEDIPFSPYAEFHKALMFYDVISLTTQKKYDKWELWNLYKDNDDDVARIKTRLHPDLLFVRNTERLKATLAMKSIPAYEQI